jgi:hypothetical protein
LLIAGAVAPTTVAADAVDAPVQTGTLGCESDEGDSTLTARARIDATFEDRLTNESLANWDGGRLVRVGAAGDCSLYVGANETATLQATLVNESDGMVTGSVDLGVNGTISLGSERGGALTIANPGPAYGTSLLVAAGDSDDRVTVDTGRFVDFVVHFAGNETRVAFWPADRSWNGEWDSRFDATVAGDRQLRLLGEVYLDELAIGTKAPAPTPTVTATATATETDDGDFPGSDFPDASELPNENTQQDDDSEAAFLGLLLLIFGGIGTAFPRGVARFGEQIDAIGSTTPADEVEPAEWNVVLTRISSAVLALIGVGFVVLALT